MRCGRSSSWWPICHLRYTGSKNGHPDPPRRHRYQRVSAAEKAEVLAEVASSPLPNRKVLREMGIPKSTYYRWLRRKDHQRLEDHAGGRKPAWNRLTLQEEQSILAAARQLSEQSCRQLAVWVLSSEVSSGFLGRSPSWSDRSHPLESHASEREISVRSNSAVSRIM